MGGGARGQGALTYNEAYASSHGGGYADDINFTGKEAAIGWARLHLPPGSYQCIGGMVYAMCLISDAVVHQRI